MTKKAPVLASLSVEKRKRTGMGQPNEKTDQDSGGPGDLLSGGKMTEVKRKKQPQE